MKFLSLIVLLSLTAEKQAAGQIRPPGSNGPAAVCTPVECPDEDRVPMPKFPFSFEGFGCNNREMNTMDGSSTKVVAASLDHCCLLQQACASICGASMGFCEKSKKSCMDNICKKHDKESIQYRQCTAYIMMNQMDVDQRSCVAHESIQKDNCRCYSKKNSGKERAAVLRAFFERYAPDMVGKAEGLAAKATDEKKFAGLIYKLLDKYPNAIARVDPPKDPFEEEMKDDPRMNNSFETLKRKAAGEDVDLDPSDMAPPVPPVQIMPEDDDRFDDDNYDDDDHYDDGRDEL